MKPFVPAKWAIKFKAVLGSYRKFVVSLPDIFEVEGRNEVYELRLKGASGSKASPKPPGASGRHPSAYVGAEGKSRGSGRFRGS